VECAAPQASTNGHTTALVRRRDHVHPEPALVARYGDPRWPVGTSGALAAARELPPYARRAPGGPRHRPVAPRGSFKAAGRDAELKKAGGVSDLGMGGVFVTCSHAPPVGAALRIFFSLPTAWDPVDLPAEVRWTRPTGFGAEFGKLTPAQAQALHELVSRLGFEEPA